MAIEIIPGETQTVKVKLTEKNGDPYRLDQGVSIITSCVKDTNGSDIVHYYVPVTGDPVLGDDVITGMSDTTNIVEGQPISGTGIPSGATVLKTPASTVSPTPSGSIQISAAATATGDDVDLIVGDIEIIDPAAWGHFQWEYPPAETTLIGSVDIEVKVVRDGSTKFKQFRDALNLEDRIC